MVGYWRILQGCFWHGHAHCKCYKLPKTRTDLWLNKINTNKANDAKAITALKKDDWKMITIWECDLKPAKAEKTLEKLLNKMEALKQVAAIE